ncbi:MAG TPA: glycosyltransferase family 2 protein [Polaromonas sp.]|uniref:glycosyltransferase family 2 protein n=1 Tax=Polaromonas sp. TaxID=1869339 RepID=UPI002D5BF66B|nr:glycosyltransferase family 2 protein [Polaromonas sp.]HYW56932.1 glycosyltransferase family 2 protein [Polaromonas sp.]
MSKHAAVMAGNGYSRTAAPQQKESGSDAAGLVCAVVVSYFPGEELDALLQQLPAQVAQVVVIDNTPDATSASLLQKKKEFVPRVHHIANGHNAGIAVALNQGLSYAVEAGYKWIVTLDQDTDCLPDMVSTLVAVSRACGPAAAVIGGNYHDPRSGRTKVAAGERECFYEQKTVITSGSLIDVRFAVSIGGFREDYFIDQVDHEFCLRVRARGGKVVISCKPVMTHSVGREGGAKIPFLGALPRHPPLRKYYIARNTVVTVAQYWWREPQWCLRRMTRLLLGLGEMALLEEQRIDKVRAFFLGIVDGLSRRMGPCGRESILRLQQ